jgi:hypothetical protein
MNADEPAAAYHRSVRLYQISNHRHNYNIQKYEPLVINMVESGNYHFENKTFIISVKYETVYATAQTVAYTLTLQAMNAREVTQFHLVNIAC